MILLLKLTNFILRIASIIFGSFWHYNLLNESSILTPAPSKRDRRRSQQIQRPRQKISAVYANKNQSIRAVERKFTRS